MVSDTESTAKSSETIENKDQQSSEQVKSTEVAGDSNITVSVAAAAVQPSASSSSSDQDNTTVTTEVQPMEAESTDITKNKESMESNVESNISEDTAGVKPMEASSEEIPEAVTAESEISKEKNVTDGALSSSTLSTEIPAPGGAEKIQNNSDPVEITVTKIKTEEVDNSEVMDTSSSTTPVTGNTSTIVSENETFSVSTIPDNNSIESQKNSNGSESQRSIEDKGVTPDGDIDKETQQPAPVSTTESGPATPGKVVQAASPTPPIVNGSSKKPKVDFSTLPTRQYLDQTVVPILLQGLSSLAKTRPEDPTRYLANYLIEHGKDFEDRQN